MIHTSSKDFSDDSVLMIADGKPSYREVVFYLATNYGIGEVSRSELEYSTHELNMGQGDEWSISFVPSNSEEYRK